MTSPNQSNTSRGLTEADQKFLAALKPDGSPTGSWNIPSATREQDVARTRARKNGWAIFDRKNWAWRITESGRTALQEQKK